MTIDEFKKKLSTPDGRTDLGFDLTGDQAAVILADDSLLTSWYERAQNPPGPAAAPDSEPTDEPVLETPAQGKAQKQVWWKREWVIAVGIIAVIILGSLITVGPWSQLGNSSNSGSVASGDSSSESSDAPVAPTGPDIPYGYHDAGNGLAYQFADSTTLTTGACSYYRNCAVLNVYAYQDCPSGVYVEANVLDSSGTIIGITNDTIGAMSPADQAKSTLGWMENGGVKVHLTDVHCMG